MEMNAYPPEPWDLHGHAYIGVWLLPRGATPAPHSPLTRPIKIFGRCIVAAAYFVYEPPSPLTYDEVMSTVLVRDGWRLRVAITHIWVNSPASRDGGRNLWSIPKELTDFDVDLHRSYTAHQISRLRVRRVRRLPFSVPVGFRTAQDRSGNLQSTSVRGRIRLGLATTRWSFEPAGPLSFLNGRQPLISLAARPFRLKFGQDLAG